MRPTRGLPLLASTNHMPPSAASAIASILLSNLNSAIWPRLETRTTSMLGIGTQALPCESMVTVPFTWTGYVLNEPSGIARASAFPVSYQTLLSAPTARPQLGENDPAITDV